MASKVKTKYTFGPDIDLNKTIIRDKNGKRITNKRAEKMAMDAIEKVLGRPSLTAKNVESPQLKVRVPI